MDTKEIKCRCSNCGSEFFITAKPKYCPVCGKEHCLKLSFARGHVSKMVSKLEDLIPKLKNSYMEYTKNLAIYNIIMCSLRVYKNRGYISEEELKELTSWKAGLPTVGDMMKQYREME